MAYRYKFIYLFLFILSCKDESMIIYYSTQNKMPSSYYSQSNILFSNTPNLNGIKFRLVSVQKSGFYNYQGIRKYLFVSDNVFGQDTISLIHENNLPATKGFYEFNRIDLRAAVNQYGSVKFTFLNSNIQNSIRSYIAKSESIDSLVFLMEGYTSIKNDIYTINGATVNLKLVIPYIQ